MREVETDVWHWEAPHPEWAGPENEALRERLAAIAKAPNEAALGVVSSYAIDDGDRLLLFDPLAVPSEIEEIVAGREPVVVLTSPWHERDTHTAWWSDSARRCSRHRPTRAPRTWRGSWAEARATPTSTLLVIGCPSESRHCPEGC